MEISEKYRLYPTKTQIYWLNAYLEECRLLWNALVKDVEDERHCCATLLTEAEIRERLRGLGKTRYQRFVRDTKDRDTVGTPTQFLNSTIQTYQKALENFWRTKNLPPGHPRKIGYPKRKKIRECNSFSWQVSPLHLSEDFEYERLRVPKLGEIKVKTHRPPRGELGTYPRIVKENERWYVVVPVEVSLLPYPETHKTVGIDLGVSTKNAYAKSDDLIPVPRPAWLKDYLKKLRLLQRKASRRFRGQGKKQSIGWYKVIRQIANLHSKVAARRRDWQHKHSMSLISQYDLIGVESGSIKGWMQSGLSGVRKSSADAAPAALREKLRYKAELYGRQYIPVNWDKTSQTCPCGKIRKKQLSERVHTCDDTCPWNGMDRDVVSAIEIHRRALQSAGTGERVGQTRQKPRKAKRQPTRNAVLETTPQICERLGAAISAEAACNNKINNLSN